MKAWRNNRQTMAGLDGYGRAALECLFGKSGLDDVVVGLQVRQYNCPNCSSTQAHLEKNHGGGGWWRKQGRWLGR